MLNELKCESCSSKDLTRQGDFLVCDYCGSRYYVPQEKDETPLPHTVTYTTASSQQANMRKHSLIRRVLIIVIALTALSTVLGVLPELTEDIFYEPVQRQSINANETGVAKNWSAVVGDPEGICTVNGSYRDYFYVKAPITITATNDCTINATGFQMSDAKYPDDALPSKLSLKQGETFCGYLYLSWYCADDGRDNEDGIDLGSFRYTARYSDYENERLSITWDFDIPSADAIDMDAQTIMTVLPNTTVRFQATYKEAFLDSSSPEAVFTMDGSNGLPVVVAVNSSFKTRLASLSPGDSVTLRGDVNALQARMPDTSLIHEVVLVNASVVE